jgi:hypothetical protein
MLRDELELVYDLIHECIVLQETQDEGETPMVGAVTTIRDELAHAFETGIKLTSEGYKYLVEPLNQRAQDLKELAHDMGPRLRSVLSK